MSARPRSAAPSEENPRHSPWARATTAAAPRQALVRMAAPAGRRRSRREARRAYSKPTRRAPRARARKAQAGLHEREGDRRPKGRQGDMSVVEGVHLYEELEERERGRIEQEGSRSPEVDGAESPHLRDPDTEVAGEGAGLLHTLRANRGVAAEEKQCRRREGGARSARRWMSARLEEVDGRALDREHVAECQREVAEGGEEEPLLARPRCEPGEQDRHRSPDGGERRPREKLAAGDGAEDGRDRPEQARQVARASLPEEPDRERAVDRRDDEQPNPFAVSA